MNIHPRGIDDGIRQPVEGFQQNPLQTDSLPDGQIPSQRMGTPGLAETAEERLIRRFHENQGDLQVVPG